MGIFFSFASIIDCFIVVVLNIGSFTVSVIYNKKSITDITAAVKIFKYINFLFGFDSIVTIVCFLSFLDFVSFFVAYVTPLVSKTFRASCSVDIISVLLNWFCDIDIRSKPFFSVSKA